MKKVHIQYWSFSDNDIIAEDFEYKDIKEVRVYIEELDLIFKENGREIYRAIYNIRFKTLTINHMSQENKKLKDVSR